MRLSCGVPDWSYRTVLGGFLFALPPERARRLALGSLGWLGASAAGRGLIDLMGHMRPAAELGCAPHGITLSGPVGLGALIDPEGCASAALSRFGAGFVEVGPVSDGPATLATGWTRDLATRELSCSQAARVELATLHAHLADAGPRAAPLWVRIAADVRAVGPVIAKLRAQATAFLLEVAPSLEPEALRAQLLSAREAAEADGQGRPVLLSLRADDARALELAQLALSVGAVGVWLRAEIERTPGRLELGAAAHDAVESAIRALRAACPDALLVAGGVLEPADAERFMRAGAQLVAADAGLVLSGPGLIKRCNEALLLAQSEREPPEALGLDAARSAWFWAFLLGLAMLLGGLLALFVASTRVVLPYDEALCGMTRGQLIQLNPRLLPFMAHDRVSLAGSMLSIGTLYIALGLNPLRRGAHWAHLSVVLSALTGFFSFFLFLGFGYFDPFHAFVTGILFQFLLLCVAGRRTPARALEVPDWRETAAWRRGQWGQLVFVALALGLCGAGAVICFLGSTSVFVETDLEFMRTTAAQLAIAHDRLVPLVAHDRASLGGMLLTNGVALLCCALWGFRAGAAWLWWALLWAGNLAFAAALGVHFVVGYTSGLHLAPAFFGWGLWWLGLALSHGWLVSARRAAH